MKNQDIFLSLRKFIKKYYYFRAFRGLLFSLAILSFIFLSIILLHYFYYFSVIFKTITFYSFSVLSLVIISEFVIVPLLRVYKILPSISNKNASYLIADAFPEIKDKLTNILELLEISDNNSLVNASITQKYNEIKIFDFSKAISYKELRKYLKYLVLPLLLFLFLAIFNKSVLIQGSEKFLNYTTLYTPQAPFKFIILNKSLKLNSGDDFTLDIQLDGDILPNTVYVNFGSSRIPMIKKQNSKNLYYYNFVSVNSDFVFYLDADNFKSDMYKLTVQPSPSILNFNLQIIPPSYTGKQAFSIKNSGDILVPFGSKLAYSFETADVDSLYFMIDSAKLNSKILDKKYTINFIAKRTQNYTIFASNKFIKKEIFRYNLTVLPDLFPSISVQMLRDTNVYSLFYFKGLISDDYGFNKLVFNYAILSKPDEEITPKNTKFNSLKINNNQLSQDFYHFIDFSDFKLEENQYIKYYFTVYDNDFISGFKFSNSQLFTFKVPSYKDFDSTLNSLNEKVDEKMNLLNQYSFDIQNDIDAFKKKMINENVSEWEKQAFIESMVKKQENMQNMLDSLKKENQEKLNQLKNFNKDNEELIKKQEEIQKMLEELMTDEIKKLLEELKKLQEKFDDKKFQNLMENQQQQMKDMNKDVERTHELLKRMEIEQKVENTIERLQQLAEQQDKLAENIEKQNEITPEQKDSLLSNEFEFKELMSEYDSIQKKNENLEKPFDLNNFEEQQEEIEKTFQETKENMFENKEGKTSKSMKKNSEQMQKMSDEMSSMMQSNMEQQNAEDSETLKFLLNNLLSFSFKQEDLYNDGLKGFSFFSKLYNRFKSDQFDMMNDFKIISDSLYALARRNPKIGKMVTDELANINSNLEKTNKNLNENKKENASIFQRNVITSTNKLALMLQESLQNMESQMSMSGNGKPQKGNQKMPGVGDMKGMQKGMQEQLEQMINDMKNGKMPSSQEMGTQIGQREAFQKMLEEMMNDGGTSEEMKKMLNEINKMNQEIKKDVINRNFTPELINKEQMIKTKLLEIEESENQRKFSNQRKSNTGEDKIKPDIENIENYFNNYIKLNDVYKKQSIILTPFYKLYYNEYIQRLAN